jgi:addiction module RelE/StbE family toxin
MASNIKRVDYSSKFIKVQRKASKAIRTAVANRVELYLKDPYNPQLHNHLLTGIYKGCRSINITGDWRAIFIEQGYTVIFVALGTHSQLYK